MKWLAATMTALAVFASPVAGQEQCQPKETIRACFDRILSAAHARDPNAETTKKPAAPQQLTQTGTSIDDFLPRLAAGLLSAGIDSGVTALTMSVNQYMRGPYTSYLPFTLQLGASLNKPQVFAQLLDSIPEARRPAVKQRMEGEFDELSDPDITAALSLETRYTGRRFEPHARELRRAFAQETAPFAAMTNEMQRLISNDDVFDPSVPACRSGDPWGRAVECIADHRREAVSKKMKDVAEAFRANVVYIENWKRDSGWDLVPDLLNNQPQVTLRVQWRPRETYAGPETITGTFRLEKGIVNFNSARAHCSDRDINRYRDDMFEGTCFSDFVNSERSKWLLKAAIRPFLQVEAIHEKAYEAPFLATDTAQLLLPRATTYMLSGGVGGYLPTTDGQQGTRIDLAGGYQIAEKKSSRTERRAHATLTLTQRLSTSVSLISGLEWSDKGEFKSSETSPLRLRLGARYKFVPAAR